MTKFDRDAFFARTMHTPDDAARAELREALRSLSKALIPLHRALINGARDEYAAATMTEEPIAPTKLLGLLNDDPFFAWLKPMTGLIVDIDEMVRRDFEREDADAIVARVERLFGNEPDAGFAAQYVNQLQRDVDVAIGHAAVRQALGKVPKKS